MSTWNWFVREKSKNNCLFPRTRLTVVDVLKARGWSGDTLAASTSVMASTALMVVSPASGVHTDHSDTACVIRELMLQADFIPG